MLKYIGDLASTGMATDSDLNVFSDLYMKPQNMPDSRLKHQGRYNSNDMKLQFVSSGNMATLYETSGNKKSQTIIDTYRRKRPWKVVTLNF